MTWRTATRPTTPRVRRIKEPHRHFRYFWDLFCDPDITDVLVPLLGENIRVYGAKMNMKAAGYGAPVEWHQDWAFYPHTNDDVLATGLLLDDCDASNGPLMCCPAATAGRSTTTMPTASSAARSIRMRPGWMSRRRRC